MMRSGMVRFGRRGALGHGPKRNTKARFCRLGEVWLVRAGRGKYRKAGGERIAKERRGKASLGMARFCRRGGVWINEASRGKDNLGLTRFGRQGMARRGRRVLVRIGKAGKDGCAMVRYGKTRLGRHGALGRVTERSGRLGREWKGRQARRVKVARSKLGKGELRSDAAGMVGRGVDGVEGSGGVQQARRVEVCSDTDGQGEFRQARLLAWRGALRRGLESTGRQGKTRYY